MHSAPHGTLIMLLVRHDGIYVAADSRRGKGHNDAEKLVRFGPQTLLALRGSAMLTDSATGEPVALASFYLQDKLQGPLPVARYSDGVTTKQKVQSETDAVRTVVNILTPFVEAFVEQWNTDALKSKVENAIRKEKTGLGVTIAQAEPDGWMLAVDIQYRIYFNEQQRVSVKPFRTSTLLHGYYTNDRIHPFWPPKCDRIIKVGPPEATADPAQFLHEVFVAFIEASPKCARDVGVPVDIAKVQNGEVTQIYCKIPWPSAPTVEAESSS